jgi:hypothetical protein
MGVAWRILAGRKRGFERIPGMMPEMSKSTMLATLDAGQARVLKEA